ncbi:MAG TPA: Crp/Fnr family transcriptional regulator [Thermoanaerobaculia bacterium]
MHNRLFDAFPDDVRSELERHASRLSLGRGVVLHRPGCVIEELYFPLDCLVSITITTQEGRTAETGVVGNREVVGVNAFMGGRETTQTEYVIQIEGGAIKVPADPLLHAFNTDKRVRDVLLKYTQAMIAQISQNAACNRLHNVQQRYARWLLEVRDRVESNELRLTQEFAAEMLGVRRATVTETAMVFELKGLLSIHRGEIRILDGDGLKQAACECYCVLNEEYDRLLGHAPRKSATVPTGSRNARTMARNDPPNR